MTPHHRMILLSALLLCCAVALAQQSPAAAPNQLPSNSMSAADLEQHGDDLRTQKSYADALDYYRLALRKQPTAVLANKIGIVELQMARFPEARKTRDFASAAGNAISRRESHAGRRRREADRNSASQNLRSGRESRERGAKLLRIRLEFFGIAHDSRREQRHALKTRKNMEMDVEDDLAARAFVELLQGEAVGVKCGLRGSGDMLHPLDQRAQIIRIDVEQTARRLLGDDQRVAFRSRHDVHEGQRNVILIDLVRGNFAAQDLSENILRIVSDGHGLPRDVRDHEAIAHAQSPEKARAIPRGAGALRTSADASIYLGRNIKGEAAVDFVRVAD